MKRTLTLLTLAFIFTLSACSSTTPNSPATTTGVTNTPIIGTDEPTNSESSGTTRNIVSGVYTVGDNLDSAQYTITCTKSDYAMKVIVFKTQEDYDTYYEEERFTNGQESAAIEQHALFDLYVKQDEICFVGLNDGYIVMVESGEGKLEKLPSPENNTELQIFSGIYFVGEDLTAGQYNLKCTEADYSMKIVIFDTTDNYLSYHKASRWTNGEETDAIQQNSSNSTYIYADDSYFLDLKEGSVLMIQGGSGKLSVF